MVERSWNADFRLPHPGSITLSDGMQLGKLKIIKYLLKELEFLNYFNKFLMNFSVWDLMAWSMLSTWMLKPYTEILLSVTLQANKVCACSQP